MAKPKAGTLPPSETKPEFEQSVRELEAKVKADAARAAMEAMTGESGQLPGGVQGSVGEDGVLRFGGAGSPKGARQSYLADEYGTQAANLQSNALLGGFPESLAEMTARMEDLVEGISEMDVAEPSPAARSFAGVEGAKALADEKEAERAERFGTGYVSGGMIHPDSGEPSEGMQYSQALGMSVREQPAHDNPYSSLLKNIDGGVEAFKAYYLDPETGEPDVVVLPVTPWQNSQEHKDRMFRAVEQASILLEENEGYLSPENIAEMRRLLATDPE